jgi:hypothetical protein
LTEPAWRNRLRWALLAAAAAIVAYQVMAPPIVGLADQGDFARMIGRFGYGPEDQSPDLKFMYVVRKYVPDPHFRYPGWEQFNSEYLFVGTAVALNRLISTDGKLDVVVVGLVHGLAFLCAFARLLWVTRRFRTAPLLWTAGLVVLTDAAYTAYWNSFYAEPAMCIFFLLLLAESIGIWNSAEPRVWQMVRWMLLAVLWVLAKPQNVPMGVLLTIFALRLRAWSGKARNRQVAAAGCAAILATSIFSAVTVPEPIRWETGYDMVFRAIIPESHHPGEDLQVLGLDPQLAKYGGTWAEGHPFYELVNGGAFHSKITPFKIALFYLLRPARFWKHIKVMLGAAFLLRDFYGNYEKSTGYPPATRSQAFSLWSRFHAAVLERASRPLFFALLVCAIAMVWRWFRSGIEERRSLEFLSLLLACCLAALFTVLLGDCWDNIKHFYEFNLLFDVCLITAAGLAWRAAANRGTVVRKSQPARATDS